MRLSNAALQRETKRSFIPMHDLCPLCTKLVSMQPLHTWGISRLGMLFTFAVKVCVSRISRHHFMGFECQVAVTGYGYNPREFTGGSASTAKLHRAG